jgi:multimeric flavodoxin WrbA
MAAKVVIVDGGPRRNWNTAQLLESAAAGARDAGAELEHYRLYELSFRGCSSCYACKLRVGAVNICALRDDLRPVLEAIGACDVLVMGSPIYWHEVTGELRCLIERLLYPCISYDNQPGSPSAASRFGRQIRVALFFSMGASAEAGRKIGLFDKFHAYQGIFTSLLGPTEYRVSCDTHQFDDYERYATGMFDAQAKLERHNTVFVEEKQAARKLVAQLCSEVAG